MRAGPNKQRKRQLGKQRHLAAKRSWQLLRLASHRVTPAQALEVTRLRLLGRSYRDIQRATGVGKSTIGRMMCLPKRNVSRRRGTSNILGRVPHSAGGSNQGHVVSGPVGPG